MKQFELVQAPKAKRSAFDLSHETKLTLNMGELVPVLCHEVLPGDRFKMNFEAFLRTLPLVSPVMHRVNLFAHAFFVPMRTLLVGERWEKFITNTVDEQLPSFADSCFNNGSGQYTPVTGDLLDYLNYGLSTTGLVTHNCRMSQMPLRGYHKIWNDHYRDQNYQAEYDFLSLPDDIYTADDGTFPGVTNLFKIRKRAWEKDYFTAALPSQQRGSAVSMPLGSYAPVRSTKIRTGNVVDTSLYVKAGGSAMTAGAADFSAGGALEDSLGNMAYLQSGLEADLSSATGSTISQLRQAFALQRWFEASMRFGRRYVEQLLGLFGVVSKDARLQRAEFIGGGKLPIQIGEVIQTSATDPSTTPQGTLAGKAVSAGSLFGLDRTFDEHGYVYIIVSVLPRTSYSGVALRQNFKTDVFDFAFPQFAHLSEQPVYKAELFNQSPEATGKQPFGYQPIYSEYRYIPDNVHGEFRGSLNFWGLQREFGSQPGLNESFVVADPPTRIFPVDQPQGQLVMQCYTKFIAIRPLPKFGTPV